MLKAALRFIRPRILVTCYAIAFLGAAVAGSITSKTILVIAILILWYIHAASANDYSDRYIDAINLKDPTDRPLISQDASHNKLWQVHFISGLLAVVFSALYGFGAVLFTVGMLVLDYAYSIKPVRISDRGILSQFLLAFAYVFYPFTLGFWSSNSDNAYPWLLTTGIYLAFVARVLLKDFRDVKGDKKHGKMTFVLRHGVEATCKTSALFWLVALGTVAYAVSFHLGLTIVLVVGLIQALIFLNLLARSSSIKGHESMVALIAKTANITLIGILIYYLAQNQINTSSLETSLIILLPCLSFLGLNFLRAIQWKRIY
jgi:4-hydroxybenzoate polyprenyltransferase